MQMLSRLAAACIALLIIPAAWVHGQTQFVPSNYFPAELEFRELRSILVNRSLRSREEIRALEPGPCLMEAGCTRWDERHYETVAGEPLRVTVAICGDTDGAYSLFSLHRTGVERASEPAGEIWDAGPDPLAFVKGAFWVRVHGGGSENLRQRVAASVSNRIGARESQVPVLVGQLPETGLDAQSIRYFLGPDSYRHFAALVAGRPLRFQQGIRIAQGRYTLEARTGVLSLIGFPTAQMAEDFFEALADEQGDRTAGTGKTYARRVGLLVGVLGGDFDPSTADALLRGIRYRYSIQWIFDKHNRQGATVWGVPVALLGTVVRSLAFTALVCALSLILGACLAFSRLTLRKYAPGNFLDRPERTEMIRLRLTDVVSAGSNGRSSSTEEEPK